MQLADHILFFAIGKEYVGVVSIAFDENDLIGWISLLVVILSHSIFSLIVFSVHTLVSLLRTGVISCRQRYKFSFELPNVIATIFLHFSAYSCRKVSKNDKFAAKSNNFWEFMLDIVEKVLTLQRI